MRRTRARPVLVGLGVAAYGVVAAVAVGALVAAGTDPVATGLLGLFAAVGLAGGVAWFLRRREEEAARVAEGVGVAVDANPAHRLPVEPAGSLVAVAEAVNRLAEARTAALREAEETAYDVRREVESERNRLAALMARLGVAVVVCNAEGRILLYNETARELVGDAALLGLGRTVFGLVDRGLVAHARQRLEAGSTTYQATTVHRGRMLRVHVAPVLEADATVTGLVLVLEDLTRELQSADEHRQALRRLTERTRASLGSIRAAAETLLEFPDLAAEDRHRFLEVVRAESDQLGRHLDEAGGPVRPLDERGLDDISCEDLVTVVADRLRRDGIACREDVAPDAGPVWLRADAHALAAVAAFVGERLGGPSLGEVALAASPVGDHVRVDLCWHGEPPAAGELAGWLEEPLGEEGATTSVQVVERHAAEVWAARDGSGPSAGAGSAHLSLLLPRSPAGAPPAGLGSSPDGVPAGVGAAAVALPGSRPEFYDFDLFLPAVTEPGQSGRLLQDLTFTVLDTETTGLDPDGGDRIVSVGAVRVVNGRVLRQETFEQLVNPGRRVPAASTAIHGLTDAMLADAPPVEDVLPALARFAEDTVLVGHDIGFDLRFLGAAARSAGVDLSHPVLDTLLLDAALYPGQPDHTLEAIAGRLGVSVLGRHTALGDALVTADVLVALLAPLQEAGIRTLADALTAGRRTFRSRAGERSSGL